MADFIKPTSVFQIRGPMGYTVRIEKKGVSGLVEHRLDLGKVLDLSWTKANELCKLLETFIEDEACIILDDMKVLEYKIGFAQKKKNNLLKQMQDNDADLVKYGEAAHRIIMEKED